VPGSCFEGDLSLVQAVARGDSAARERLATDNYATVLRYARSITDSRAAAEDVTQAAFLSAMASATHFRGESSARTWLLVIARNEAARSRRKANLASTQSLQELAEAAGWGSTEEARASFAQQLETHDAIEKGFARLGVEERGILALRDIEGLPGEEVAAVLGLSLPAMKSRLHRARLELAAAIKQGERHGR